MNGLMKKAGLGVALVATALTAAAPASAQRWGGERGEWRGGGERWHGDGIGAGGAAVLGGLLGLGVGAAIASNNHPYYNGGYYAQPGYYYNRPYNYYQPHCWTQWRWDAYYEQRVPVRVCN